MTLKNYQSTIAIVISALLVTTSCDENSNLPKPAKTTTGSQTQAKNPSARLANYTFDGTEGGPITLDVATNWVANYSNQNSGKLTAHFIGRNTILKMLAKSGCIGVRFYYSVDDLNNPNIFATGADATGQDFLSNYGMRGKISSVALNAGQSSTESYDASQADSVVLTTEKNWKSNYTLTNLNGIQAHFFGYQILQQILSQAGCVGIRCYYALNDAGVQQLLLIGVTSSGQNILPISSTGGRTTDGGGTIADMSLPCPSYCSGS